MNETRAKYTQQQHTDPRLQQAYNTALLHFQAYLLEKQFTGEAVLMKTRLMNMISCN